MFGLGLPESIKTALRRLFGSRRAGGRTAEEWRASYFSIMRERDQLLMQIERQDHPPPPVVVRTSAAARLREDEARVMTYLATVDYAMPQHLAYRDMRNRYISPRHTSPPRRFNGTEREDL